MTSTTLIERATLKTLFLADALKEMIQGGGKITIEHTVNYKITLTEDGGKTTSAMGESLFSAVRDLAYAVDRNPLNGN
jgi:hypothetical protein